MLKEEEIAYFRKNVIKNYIKEVMENIEEKNTTNMLLNHTAKKCRKCGRILPISMFPKNSNNDLYSCNYCKECAEKMAKSIKKYP